VDEGGSFGVGGGAANELGRAPEVSGSQEVFSGVVEGGGHEVVWRRMSAGVGGSEEREGCWRVTLGRVWSMRFGNRWGGWGGVRGTCWRGGSFV